jgi:hypothetical protein
MMSPWPPTLQSFKDDGRIVFGTYVSRRHRADLLIE